MKSWTSNPQHALPLRCTKRCCRARLRARSHSRTDGRMCGRSFAAAASQWLSTAHGTRALQAQQVRPLRFNGQRRPRCMKSNASLSAPKPMPVQDLPRACVPACCIRPSIHPSMQLSTGATYHSMGLPRRACWGTLRRSPQRILPASPWPHIVAHAQWHEAESSSHIQDKTLHRMHDASCAQPFFIPHSST